MAGIGIDIGSTATKAVVADPSGAIAFKLVIPTGFSSVEVAEQVRRAFSCEGFEMDEMPVVATGYGRVAVPYANKVVTEITCHARGAAALFGEDGTVIDIGGQDTKAIGLAGGKVRKFVMNDKCSAGTGRFLEIMADRLGVSQAELARLAAAGQPTVISNMCTVFAESEVISLVGKGEPRENIGRGARVHAGGAGPRGAISPYGRLVRKRLRSRPLGGRVGRAGGLLPRRAFRGGVGRGHHRRRDGRRSVAFRSDIDVAVRGWPARLSPCGLTCALRGHARRLHLCAERSYDAGEDR